MSIKASLSSDGVEEFYTPPTLKEMCLYKCLTKKKILTTEVELNERPNGTRKTAWEKFRLKEPVQRDLVKALLDAGDQHLFMVTPMFEAVLAAIRMSQPEHLVKVHVNNSDTLQDHQLELLLSGGNVRSLDIEGCLSLKGRSLDAINKFGSKLEYLRLGSSFQILPSPSNIEENSAILRTPNLKTFIVSDINASSKDSPNYWRFLIQDFISNLEDLQIRKIRKFITLEFLEPARSNLTSLTLRTCGVTENQNAWAPLFLLNNLRSLDLLGSWISGEALEGENFVQRLLTAMPNLTHLTVDPDLFRGIYVDTPRGQPPMVKRLEFLGIMGNIPGELTTAKFLANDVAYFGTIEGELRVLEYYSNRLSPGFFDSTLEWLLKRLSKMGETPPCTTVTVINLLIKTFKNNGVNVASPALVFEVLKKQLTTDIVAKLGDVLLNQCAGVIFSFMSRSSRDYYDLEPEMISGAIDNILVLDTKLDLGHYATLVPMVMQMSKILMTENLKFIDLEDIQMGNFKDLLKKITQLLEKVLERFPEEINELWGISSLIVVIKELRAMMVSYLYRGDRAGLVEIFSNMIPSVRTLCLNSGPRREAFHYAGGIGILMDFLNEILDGCLGLADGVTLPLLEILKIILQDTNINLNPHPWDESEKIASRLEKLLLSADSKWHYWNRRGNSERTTKLDLQLEIIGSLLNFLDANPSYDYKASADVKNLINLE